MTKPHKNKSTETEVRLDLYRWPLNDWTLEKHTGFVNLKYDKIYLYFENFIKILISASLNRQGFKEITLKPKHNENYTDLAIGTYHKAKFHYYKFQKKYSPNPNRAVEAWLGVGFGYLFKRNLTDHEIKLLSQFIEKYTIAKARVKALGDNKARKSYDFINTTYIDGDGYICMKKIIPSPTNKNRKEEIRLEELLKAKEIIRKL